MSDTTVQLCVLEVGSESYVIDLGRVDEILGLQTPTPVPKGPPFLEGVVKLRGEVVPVVDVRKQLGVTPRSAVSQEPRVARRQRMVVCRLGRRRVGFLVDGVSRVLRVSRSDLRPAPLTATPGRTPHVVGVVGEGNELRLMLDVLSLVGGEAS